MPSVDRMSLNRPSCAVICALAKWDARASFRWRICSRVFGHGPVYSLTALNWIWMIDFLVSASKDRPVRGRRFYLLLLELVVSRASHVMIFMFVPYLFVGSWLAVLAGYLIFWSVFGLSLSMIFTLAHVTEVCADGTRRRSIASTCICSPSAERRRRRR